MESIMHGRTFIINDRYIRRRHTSAIASTEYFDQSASSEKLACSVGDSPTGGKVRDPVAWVASVEETNRMKPTDKAILGMVSESPGRNASEPRNGLDKIKSGSRAPFGRAKAA
jgi:hypothetical protein